MTETATLRRSTIRPEALVTALVAIGVLALIGYAAISGDTRFGETGDSFPGYFTAIAAPVGYFITTMLVTLTVGGLLYVALCARPGKDGIIGVEAYRAHRLASRASVAWLVAALVMVVITASERAGQSVGTLLTSPHVWSLIDASEQAVAWLVSAFCALLIVVFLRLFLTWATHAILLLYGATGAVALPVAGNAGQGPGHDYTTTAVIVFATAVTMVVGLKIAAALTVARDTLDDDQGESLKRVLIVAVIGDAAALIYGLILVGFLVPMQYLFTTAYGRWTVIAAIGLIVATVADVIALRRVHRGQPLPSAALSLLWTSVTAGITVQAAIAGMATRIAPGLLAHTFTGWDVYLGYELPDPPSVWRLISLWRLDLFLGVLAIVMAAGYLVGVIYLRRKGIDWAWGRTLAWVSGCVMLLIATSSGMRTYCMGMFSVHMAEHMTLNMFVPVLLVLGAPVTLALRALPTAPHGGMPGPREWIVSLVHSRFTQIFSNPAVAFLMFVLGLYVVYFTPLFDTLSRYHWGHDLMSVHFLMTGYIFYWIIIGIDPGPKRLPFLARLGLLFAIMPFHAFFGIATMTMNTLIGGTFYQSLALPWMGNLHQDQFLGGAIAWGTSEVPAVLVVTALVYQWAKSDRRSANRSDRKADVYADDELDAYNRMLTELSKHR